MPEGLEAELYRRAAERARGRTIERVTVDDRSADSDELAAVLPGASFTAARRIGKLVLLDLDDAAGADVLGLHFGMTGRLVVDGDGPIETLEYGSARDDPGWDRLVIEFDDGGILRVNDPRRWATFRMDPPVEELGPDLLGITADELIAAFGRRRAAVKAVLLDQAAVAGYGNMTADEILWQTGISPVAPARDVPAEALRRLASFAPGHLLGMLDRGGSHRGTIAPDVRAGLPPCPRDGVPLRRDRVGGRTTVWCTHHQVAGAPGDRSG